MRGVPTGHPSPDAATYDVGMDNRAEVREFLMSRRAKLTPDAAGITGGANRRVAGLRRTEVATLAGVSVEYYAKLERGAIAGASASVLDAISRALQLDDTERAHLFDLARAADGIPSSGRPRRRATKAAAPRPSLQWALSAITDGVAFVRDQHQDLLATNALGRAFYSPLIGDGGRTPNLARFQFLDPRLAGVLPGLGPVRRDVRRRSCAAKPAATPTTRACRTSSASSPPAATPSDACGAPTTCAPTERERSGSTTRSWAT